MNLLAFDTSTQTLGIALSLGDQLFVIEDEGGARTSDILLPRIAELLRQHQIELKNIDAIAFGAGPGAFTGLRAAAAATQGMALGANLPVIPIITLQAGAQEYLMQHLQEFTDIPAPDILVQLDARMNEWYWAHYQWKDQAWHTLAVPALSTPEALQTYQEQAHSAKTITIEGTQMHGLVELAKQAWLRGETVSAAEALPLYIRNKVALTTEERIALHAKK